jgi:ribosomal protein L13
MLNDLMLKHYSEGKEDIRYVNLLTDPPSDRQWRPQRFQVSNLFVMNRTVSGMLAYVNIRARQKFSHLRRLMGPSKPDASVLETVRSAVPG